MNTNYVNINPKLDGKTHIRVSPMAKTKLGQMLDIGANIDVVHPAHGRFSSLLAYWVWLADGGVTDAVRNIHQGDRIRTNTRLVIDRNLCKDEVVSLLEYWIKTNPEVRQLLMSCNLPIVAYDDLRLGPDNYHVIHRDDIEWYIDAVIRIKNELVSEHNDGCD